jgi:hypothetical protein
MARIAGETIGRRIVTRPGLASARDALPRQMAEPVALIHANPADAVGFLPGACGGPIAGAYLDDLEQQLDTLPQAHPAIELGLRRLP